MAVGATAMLVLSCGDGAVEPIPPPTPPARLVVTTVTVRPDSVALTALGQMSRLTAEVRDQHGQAMTGPAIAWSSSDGLVATVNESGLVTAAGNGGTTVAARAGSVSGTAAVAVFQLPAAVAVAPESLTLRSPGDTATITATVTDANGHRIETPEVVWASADPSVALVDADGLVTAVSAGATEVTAMAGELTAGVGVDVITPSPDREVLEALYRATGGDDWTDHTNWLTDAPLSDWVGVRTDESGRVDFLDLGNNNLNGAIPASIGQLDRLFILDLRRNPLQGPIPPELGNLKQLRDLILDNTELSGSLPPEMGDMTGLRSLGVSKTRLSGPLPETFARLALESWSYPDLVDTFERWSQRGGVACRDGDTRRSTRRGWWNWSVRDGARTGWLASSSPRRRRSGAGWSGPTWTRGVAPTV